MAINGTDPIFITEPSRTVERWRAGGAWVETMRRKHFASGDFDFSKLCRRPSPWRSLRLAISMRTGTFVCHVSYDEPEIRSIHRERSDRRASREIRRAGPVAALALKFPPTDLSRLYLFPPITISPPDSLICLSRIETLSLTPPREA